MDNNNVLGRSITEEWYNNSHIQDILFRNVEEDETTPEHIISKLGSKCWCNTTIKPNVGGYIQHFFTIGEQEYKQKRSMYAHRVMYAIFNDGIPEPKIGEMPITIDHICTNKQCCNPDHLTSLTRSENSILRNVEYKTARFNELCKHVKHVEIDNIKNQDIFKDNLKYPNQSINFGAPKQSFRVKIEETELFQFI